MTQQHGTGGDDSDGHRGAGGDPADLLTEHLDFIKATVRKVARRHRLDAAEIEEFEGEVLLKLCDRDYAVLRSFEGRSRLTTYLVTVINRAYLDYRNKKWGKWRPSAVAKRLGPRTILLDRMVRTEGRPIEEVQARLAAAGDQVDRETLLDLLEQLPLRTQRRAAGEEALESIATPHEGPDAGIEESERQRTARLTEHHLQQALGRLSAEQRTLILLVYSSGVPISRFAERNGMKPRALYTILQHCYAVMLEYFESTGLDRKAILDLLGRATVRIRIDELRPAGPGKRRRGPSHTPEGEEPA